MNIGGKEEFKNHYLVTITVIRVLGKKKKKTYKMDSKMNGQSVGI